jgi:hypothetical protein
MESFRDNVEYLRLTLHCYLNRVLKNVTPEKPEIEAFSK